VSPTCPAGHASRADDYCDVCGLKLGPTDVAMEPVAPEDPSDSSGPSGTVDPEPSAPSAGRPIRICPNCHTDTDPTGEFCENCGYDFDTGQPVDGTTKPTRVGWEAIVTADRSFFDRFDVDAVAFPSDAGERRFAITGSEATIGRRRSSDAKGPTIDLSTPPEDVAVSHDHAVLARAGDGWSLVDRGSSNGTYLNDDDQPLVAGEVVALGETDRIHVGAWTTITLRARTVQGSGSGSAEATPSG
jgi:hypothetical protein